MQIQNDLNQMFAATSRPAGTARAAASDSTGESGGASTPGSTATDELVNSNMFLRLLVAQMQNQNPLSPSDPMQFVSQLAEFSSLEQTIAMRTRLDEIKEALVAQSPASPPAK